MRLPLKCLFSFRAFSYCAYFHSANYSTVRPKIALTLSVPMGAWSSLFQFRCRRLDGTKNSKSKDDNSFRRSYSESRIRIKEFKYFNPKNGFLALGNMIWVVHPGPDPDFLLTPEPGSRVKKAPDPGSVTLIVLRADIGFIPTCSRARERERQLACASSGSPPA
jgi:hypothetical protein